MAANKFAYDLVVIGGGSGGVRAARISASHGARVALIELSMKHGPPSYTAIGGTCVNVGCVPKKLLVYASKFAHEFKLSEAYGFKQAQEALVDWATLVENKNTEITRLNGAYDRILNSSPKGTGSMRIIEGFGSLVDPHTVKISSPLDGAELEQLTTSKVLIAVGGWPLIPSDLAVGRELVQTSNEMFYLQKLPKKAIVVGGGYIAVEFAGILHGLGVEVTQVYRGEMFLRGFDDSVRAHLKEEMGKRGITLQFNANPVKVEKSGPNLVVTNNDGSVIRDVGLVMYATGRAPKLDKLGLDRLGIKVGKKGEILVSEGSETNIPGVYAVGDCTERMDLTPVALREGHNLADFLFGSMPLRTVKYDLVPSAVFSQPEIGSVGLTEAQAGAKYPKVKVFVSTFKPMKTGFGGREEKSLFKLLVDEASDRVVGLHLVTDNAGEITQGFAVAFQCGATKAQFDETIGIHPTSAEELVTMRTPSYWVVNGVKQASGL